MSNGICRRNEDGSWGKAEPLPYLGWKGRTEDWLRRHGLHMLAGLLATLDERRLGR